MPEPPEEMYCSQQICIPPTFPYLLRQYAKAAIRTQPSDLLKWSTAYFRCLALNLPPPVKPRLEYPIPLDYNGITPGWLKTLVLQMPNAHTISFKLLWDRWIGACLKHNTLIEILLLGRFTNNQAIPWLKFIGLCAGHLTENLTHTMVMVCEILTEEPEGGSAMIPVKTFMDIYRFLANIDASKPQHLPNIYFTDSVLGLFDEEVEKKSTPTIISSEEVIAVAEIEEVKEEVVEEMVEEDTSAVVSCPDITAEERPEEPLEQTDFAPKGTEVLPESIEAGFVLAQAGDGAEEKVVEEGGEAVAGDGGEEGEDRGDEETLGEDGSIQRPDTKQEDVKVEGEAKVEEETKADGEVKTEKATVEEAGEEAERGEGEDAGETKEAPPTTTDAAPTREQSTPTPVEGQERSPSSPTPPEDAPAKPPPTESDDEKPPPDSPMSPGDDDEDNENEEEGAAGGGAVGEKRMSVEDKVKGYRSVDTVQEDVTGRFPTKERTSHQYATDGGGDITEESVEGETESMGLLVSKWPAGGVSIDASQMGEDTATTRASYDLNYSDMGEAEEYVEGKRAVEDAADLPVYEWFDIPVVPGIGPVVPIELVEIVDEYMTKMAKIQHGVVMPRNIRHFSCPPLEVFTFPDE